MENRNIERRQSAREVLRNIRVGVIIIDSDSHSILFANEEAAILSETTVDKMLGKRCQRYICTAFEGTCPVGDMGQTLNNAERPLIRSDGTILQVLKTVRPINFDNRPCFLETFIDYTEIKHLSEQLEIQEERLSLAITIGHEGIWDYDKEKNKLYFDLNFYKMAGYENNAFPADFKQWLKKVHSDYREQIQEKLNMFLTGKEKEYYCEFKFLHKEGHYIWIQARGNIVAFNSDGEAIRFLGIHIDITESKNREKRARFQNLLQMRLLKPGSLKMKAEQITKTIISATKADFARIWIVGEKDLCTRGCIHNNSELSDKYCSDAAGCLHLISSSGKYDSINGRDRRIPLGPYRIGNIFKGKDDKTINNDLANSTFIENMEWIKKNSYISFAGFKLTDSSGERIGVLALYSRQIITAEIETYLESIAGLTSQIIINNQSESAFKKALSDSERANNLMNGREIRIRQIKEEVNTLLGDLGQPEKYSITDRELSPVNVLPGDIGSNALSLAEDAEIARRELIESNEQLSLIKQAVNSSSDAIAISTVSGDIFYINHSFTALFGYEIHEMAMTDIIELFADKKNVQNSLALAAAGIPLQEEVYMISRQKRGFPVYMRSAPFKDSDKRILGTIWNFTDISVRKQSEIRIKKYTEKIEEDLKEKKDTLRKANLLQQSFIQKQLPIINNFNIQALFLPCESLGGDFFKILKGKHENKLIIFIGDCTDHGLKASMDAALLSSIITPHISELYISDRTDHFLTNISKDFMVLADEDQYPTMLAMVIDLNRGRMYYSNANSELPYLLRNGKITKLPKVQGMHIGYFNEPVYKRQTFSFRHGDRILLYSDAVIEIENEEGGRNNREGFEKLLRESNGSSSGSFRLLIKKLSRENGGLPLEDDLTLIQLEYKKAANYHCTINDLERLSGKMNKFKKLLSDYDYSRNESELTAIALSELIINGHTHGNKSDRAKYVTVEGKVDCSRISLRISDMGEGFDVKSIPDPVINIEEIMNRDVVEEYTHGRGINIASRFFDSIRWNKQGNSVLAVKKKGTRLIFTEEN